MSVLLRGVPLQGQSLGEAVSKELTDYIIQGQVITMDTFRPLEVYTVIAVIYFVVLVPLTWIVKRAEKNVQRSH